MVAVSICSLLVASIASIGAFPRVPCKRERRGWYFLRGFLLFAIDRLQYAAAAD